MANKLPKKVLDQLKIYEPQLQRASRYGQFKEAERVMKIIQHLFVNNRSHYRLLRAKNWFFQAAFEDNRIDYAIRGFETIRIRANENTRIYLEATGLLGICHLRKKNIEEAKKYIREAVLSINNIRSNARRNQFQKRIIDRIETESILGFISVENAKKIDEELIQKEAIKLIQSKSETQIYEQIGQVIPRNLYDAITGIKDYSVNLLPAHDQKLLYPARKTISKAKFGKKIIGSIHRIVWRSVCNPDSQIFKLWNKKIPEVYNQGYFLVAVATTYAKFSLGFPLLASGVLAIMMQYSAKEFCENYSPQDIMIEIKDKA